MDQTDQQRAGAGGNWPRYREQPDPQIVKQLNDASCVAAAGEMLAAVYGQRLPQEEIQSEIGDLANSELLIEYFSHRVLLEGGWGGGIVDAQDNKESVQALIESKPAFLAILREGVPIGHAVIVRAADDGSFVGIEDPYDQTSYNMTFDDFIQVLSEVVFRR